MEIQGVRVHLVVLALAAGLGLLFGLRQVYHYSQVDQPLSSYFAEQSDVLDYETKSAGGSLIIKVKLDQVPNLRERYRSLEDGVRGILPGRQFTFEIGDTRNDELIIDYYDIHYILQEGLATGGFTEMRDSFTRAVAAQGLDRAQVYVDSERLYVQLHRGDAYLYELIPRGPAGNGGKGASGQ